MDMEDAALLASSSFLLARTAPRQRVPKHSAPAECRLSSDGSQLKLHLQVDFLFSEVQHKGKDRLINCAQQA
jgi:hypothetical protein